MHTEHSERLLCMHRARVTDNKGVISIYMRNTCHSKIKTAIETKSLIVLRALDECVYVCGCAFLFALHPHLASFSPKRFQLDINFSVAFRLSLSFWQRLLELKIGYDGNKILKIFGWRTVNDPIWWLAFRNRLVAATLHIIKLGSQKNREEIITCKPNGDLFPLFSHPRFHLFLVSTHDCQKVGSTNNKVFSSSHANRFSHHFCFPELKRNIEGHKFWKSMGEDERPDKSTKYDSNKLPFPPGPFEENKNIYLSR